MGGHRYRVVHNSIYGFGEPIGGCRLTTRLEPRALAWQQCGLYQLVTRPLFPRADRSVDGFGNAVSRYSLEGPLERVEIVAISEVTVQARPPVPVEGSPSWQGLEAPGPVREAVITAPGLSPQTVLQLQKYMLPSFSRGRPLLPSVHDLMERIYADFVYDPAVTDVNTPVEEVLRTGRGVCQDFSRLLVSGLRCLGVSAYYVSGYVYRDDDRSLRRIGRHEPHSWVALEWPGGGRVELDPTNNCLADERYITLGWGLDYEDVAPVTGEVDAVVQQQLKVSVDVERL